MPSTLAFTVLSLCRHGRQIELRLHLDAEFAEGMARLGEHLGGVEQAFDGMQPTLRQVPP